MYKYLSLFIFIFISASSFAANSNVNYEPIPCTVDNGLITNTRGFGNDPNPEPLCDFQANSVKLNVYKFALCTQEPIFNQSSTPTNLSSCTYIYDSATPTLVTVSNSSGLNISDVTQPAAGTYPYALVIMSNTLYVKGAAHFDGTRISDLGSTSGAYCWTNGSVLSADSDNNPIMQLVSGNGVTCGNTVGGNYDFNQVTWTWSTWPGSIYTEDVPNGRNTDYFLNDSLIGTGTKTRWASVHRFDSPVTITPTTSAIEMAVNISLGTSIRFNNSTGKVKWIEDAPFAYIIRPVN
jgi:hypothetical protein